MQTTLLKLKIKVAAHQQYIEYKEKHKRYVSLNLRFLLANVKARLKYAESQLLVKK